MKIRSAAATVGSSESEPNGAGTEIQISGRGNVEGEIVASPSF